MTDVVFDCSDDETERAMRDGEKLKRALFAVGLATDGVIEMRPRRKRGKR